MGLGINIITSNQASKMVQDSAFQVLSEGSLKAVARPAFTLADKSASIEARKYSATKELIFQSVSMLTYFAIITTVFQKGGYKFLKNLPKFKNYEALKSLIGETSVQTQISGAIGALAQIAKTGNINDLIQDPNDFLTLTCGDSDDLN